MSLDNRLTGISSDIDLDTDSFVINSSSLFLGEKPEERNMGSRVDL